MTGEQAGLFTLTSFDGGQSLRLPNLRVTIALADRRVIEAPLGIAPLVVGTSADCDLVVADPRVSRRHCELQVIERGVTSRLSS